jgi:adenosylcobinamide amidohydrolase
LTVSFADEHAVTSWAPVGGGSGRARTVVWHQVDGAELAPPVDPARLLAERLAARGMPDAVAMLTARRVDRHLHARCQWQQVSADVVATVGLGNQVRVGDPPGDDPRLAGTINILCRVSEPLTPAAALEAMSIVAEARTLAVREAALPHPASGRFASGTGTDCIVLATPLGVPRAAHAGKHTAIGHVIGAAVADAVGRGVEEWLAERRGSAETR